MISRSVNLTTGPVLITPQVQKALSEPATSHRSTAFKQLFYKTTELLCSSFQVRKTFLLTGSGTLANEAMLHEIKHVGGRGLILSNGEFGSRLIEQARRNALDFLTYKLSWGERFDRKEIDKILLANPCKWILFCHCETSTGTINDLDGITALAKTYDCLCFVDCMSTVGTRRLNLSKVAMATASSGKGLASIPGLAIIFSNIESRLRKETPVYLDLNHYWQKEGIPFTVPSNLVKALYISIRQKLSEDQFELIQEYRNRFFGILSNRELIPFSTREGSVFTIAASKTITQRFIKEMERHNLVISYESDYLKARNWCQLAMFGYYTEAGLKYVLKALNNSAVHKLS